MSEDLRGRIAVVSPHLDDAVLSLGASIARATRAGAAVSIVTVLAGHEDSEEEAGKWDSGAGFPSAGAAAAARAREDDDACSIVGATPIRLPYWDRQYERGGSSDTIFQAVAEATADADAVLLPGFPLKHEDHVWVTKLVLDRGLANGRIGFYTEQPYAAWGDEAPRTLVGPERPWFTLEGAPTDQFLKLRACRAYTTQVPLLGGTPTLLGILAYETRQGGESLSWLEGDDS